MLSTEAAKLEVQRLLAEANSKIEEAEKIMDQYRFSTSFLDRKYCPRNITEYEHDEGETENGERLPVGQYVDVGYGGCWQSSSDMC